MDNNPKSASTALGDEKVLFKWDHQIRMLFNPVLWGNFVVCFGIPAHQDKKKS